MEEERVLPPPAVAVLRVVRVEVQDPPVAVTRHAVLRHADAVDGLPAIGEASEDLVEAPIVGPVAPDLHPRERPSPVRELEAPGALLRKPGAKAEVGEIGLPPL